MDHFPEFTLRQLAYLVAAADAGSISGAALTLQLSTSAVADALNELERIIGTPLTVRRKAKGLTLTTTGTRLVREARTLLAQAQEITTASHATDASLTGTIVIACYPTLAPLILPVLLDEFGRAHPQLELRTIELSHPQLDGKIESGAVDVAFVYDTLIPGNPHRSTLMQLNAHALLAPTHPLAALDRVPLADLAQENLILLDVPPSSEHTRSLFHAQQLTPKIRYTTGSFETVRSLVGRGLGYGIAVQRVPNHFSYEGKEVVAREIVPAVAPIGVDIIWSAERPLSHRVEALLRFAAMKEWAAAALSSTQ